MSQASLLLQNQLKDLCKAPLDGFSAGLVTIIGPPYSLYDAIMSFPPDYPQNPQK